MTNGDNNKNDQSGAPEDRVPETADELLKATGKDITGERSELDKCKEELAQYKDRYLRLYAEFDNARKRMEREKQEFVKYANEGLIVEFLTILDDLQRSVEAAMSRQDDYKAFLKGIEMVMAHIHDMLKRYDVKAMDVKGKKFDPHCHEVLMQEEKDDIEEGTILEEFQRGYYLGDRVIRTAKVKVAKSKEG